MSLRAKFISTLALCAAFAAFSMAAMGQDTTPKVNPDGTTTPQKGFGRHSHREGFRGGPGGHRGMMGMMRGLNLTDAQKEQIRSIREGNKPDPATMEQMKAFREAKQNGTLTPEQQQQAKALHQQFREKGESVHKQIMAVFTPEQLQQMEQNKQEMKKRFEERRQQWQQRKQQTPPASTTDKPTDN